MNLPTFDDFAAARRARGFDEVLERRWDANVETGTHSHPFAVEALVVAGDFWLICGDDTRHLHAGDTFELARDVPHAEHYGPAGATYWVARRSST